MLINPTVHKLNVDIESYSTTDIKRAGAWKYWEDPTAEVILFGYSLDGAPIRVVDLTCNKLPPQIIDALKSPDVLLSGWNVSFEWLGCSKHLNYELPTPKLRDTMLSAAYCGFPLALEAAGEAMGLGEDKKKIAAGKRLIRYFSVPCKPTKTNGGRTRNLPEHAPADWLEYIAYNAGDVRAEMAIEEMLSPWPVPDWLQHEWELTLIQNNRGVGIDKDLVAGALHCYEIAQERLIQEAREITGLENPNSVQQLLAWLSEEMKVPIDGLDKQSVGIYLGLTSNTEKSKRVLEIRQELGKSSVKKFHAMEDAMCSDGRIRGVTQFYGAHTGRAAGRMIQTQNFPRSSVSNEALARAVVKAEDTEMLGMLYSSVPDTLSSLLRSALVPAPGNTMAAIDLSSIEARMLAVLAGEQWMIDVFKADGRIYEHTAARAFKIPVESIDKKSPYRQRGKVMSLACGYQGGVGAISAMDYNNEIPDEEKPGLVQQWREASPNIVQFWYDIDRAVKDTICTGRTTRVKIFEFRLENGNGLTFLTILLPSRRKLYYPSPFIAEGNFGKDAIWYYGVHQQTRKWTPIQTYGGRICENITQSVSRDVLYEKMTQMEREGIPLVFSVHDEAVADVKTDDPGRVLKRMEEIMCAPVPWLPELPLGADGWAGEWYRK